MSTHFPAFTRRLAPTARRARTTLITTGTTLAVWAAAAGAQTVDQTTTDHTADQTSAERPTPTVPQAIIGHGLELRPFTGALVPTGTQRDLLTDAVVVGGQLGWQFHPNFALTGSFGWSPSKDRTTASATGWRYTGRQETVDLYQYDLGVEARLPIATTASWTAAPFIALGGGGRSYHYRDLAGMGTETNAVGYGALGLDLAPTTGPVGIRLQARDNVSAFKGLHGEYLDRTARNDVQLTAGLTYRF